MKRLITAINKKTRKVQEHQLQLQNNDSLRYFLYVPPRVSKNAPVLVSVHGISRNASTHARRFARFAERHGVVVVAPLFDEQQFPNYQRLGLKGGRADLALNDMLDEVAELTGANTSRVYMFGYSGGAQFVHRYAMAYPHRVTAIAVGAAGWYTFPDPSRRFPYGIAAQKKRPELEFNAASFLRIPTYIMVGEQDTAQDSALRQSSKLNEQQGNNRFERGQRWAQAMELAARQHGLNTEYRFMALPDADHSFSRSVKAGGLAKQVFKCLFGSASTRQKSPHRSSVLLEPQQRFLLTPSM